MGALWEFFTDESDDPHHDSARLSRLVEEHQRHCDSHGYELSLFGRLTCTRCGQKL